MERTRRLTLSVLLTLVLSPLAAQAATKRVAVLEFQNPAGLVRQEVAYVTNLVRGVASRLPEKGYMVMTKENMLQLLPPDVDLATCEDAKCEVAFGKMVGADYVASGQVVRFGRLLKVSLVLHDTRSSALKGSENASADTVEGLERPVKEAAARLFSNLAGWPDEGAAPPRTGVTFGGGTVKQGVAALDKGETIVNETTDDTGFLVVTSTPNKATLFLNGKEIGTTPKQLEQMVGRYVVTAELGKFYHPARQVVSLTTAGAEVALTLTPAFGSLKVTSQPSGAELWLDGEKVGVTPYEDARKPSGNYEVRVVHAHHLSHRGTIMVSDGMPTLERVTLEPNYGALDVSSEPPGAAITLNGQATQKITPTRFDKLEPGVYTVGLSLTGYGDWTDRATVVKLGRTKLAPSLQAKLGLLSVMSAYEDGEMCRGEVYVDGEAKGKTPVKLELTATSHELRVVCERGEKSETVTVTHNEKSTLDWRIPTGPETGIDWVKIPGGTFQMGSKESSNEQPVHRVRVKAFELARTEVTNGQYLACVKAGGCTSPHWDDGSCYVYVGSVWRKGKLSDSFRGDNQPVVCVDWSQAVAFSRWAGGRLPTEAEWEYAARSGGRDQRYPWGNEKASCRRAIMNDGGLGCGKKQTWPVCSKASGNSAHGLCDLAGNVWEWVEDWYHGDYKGAPSDASAWTSPAGSNRVVRGGGCRNVAGNCRAADRGRDFPGNRFDSLGFRPARSIP